MKLKNHAVNVLMDQIMPLFIEVFKYSEKSTEAAKSKTLDVIVGITRSIVGKNSFVVNRFDDYIQIDVLHDVLHDHNEIHSWVVA